MLTPADRVVVGVSGGADSVCLLMVLQDLGFTVAAAHLNHGLRGSESDEDETFTAALCARLGVPFFSKRVEIPSDRGNIEAAGRQQRKLFFAELVRLEKFTRIALAHTRDDRVETFFLNLLRGSGPGGLTAMPPVSAMIIRPLISVSRQEVELFLRDRGESWRTDSSNSDVRFARNRVRLEVLPSLTLNFNPRLGETLGRTIEILDDENTWMQVLTDKWLAENGTNNGIGLVIKTQSLVSIPLGLRRRVVRAAIQQAGCEHSLQDLGFDHVEAALELLEPGRSGKQVQLPGGLTVTRSFDEWMIRATRESPGEFDYPLQIPGEIHIPESGHVFRATIVSKLDAESTPDRVIVDGGNLGPYVRIRNWKPGDYYRPVGLPAGKLKKLFQRARIPRYQRHRWPVIVADSSIVWVASFPVARDFAPRGCSQRMVAFETSPIDGSGLRPAR